MAKQVKKPISVRKSKKSSQASKVVWNFPLNKQNFLVIGIGLIIILLGYGAMATGLGDEFAAVEGNWNSPMAIGVGPALLVIGYCIVIPYGIIKFFGNTNESK